LSRGLVVVPVRQRDRHEQHAIDGEPAIDLHQPHEARAEKAGDDQQHQRQRDLRHHERCTGELAPVSSAGSARRLGQFTRHRVDFGDPRLSRRSGDLPLAERTRRR
jgi:hypothetical protein